MSIRIRPVDVPERLLRIARDDHLVPELLQAFDGHRTDLLVILHQQHRLALRR